MVPFKEKNPDFLYVWLKLILVVVSRDPVIFHHLPASASALWGRVEALSSEGGQIVEVSRAQIPSDVWGGDPEHGPEK